MIQRRSKPPTDAKKLKLAMEFQAPHAGFGTDVTETKQEKHFAEVSKMVDDEVTGVPI